jgi:NAD+ kinase
MSKKLAKVLIVFKKSTFQLQALEHKEPRFLKLLEEGHSSIARVKTAHDEHFETLIALEKALKERNIDYVQIARADLKESIDDVDLVISVGGDGTFLDASHSVHSVPLLGVNSARSSSFGHFCLGHAENIAKIIDGIQDGSLQPKGLLRLELSINGNVVPELVLNEVLVCHSNPAGTSRYFIEIEGVREEQRSSGIWIGTPSGSTGSLKSAGGRIMPIIAQEYQFAVREPWTRPGQKFNFIKGVLPRSQQIFLTSQMRTGALYIDGQHIDYSFSLGDEVIVKVSNKDLMAYVDPDVNDIFAEEASVGC